MRHFLLPSLLILSFLFFSSAALGFYEWEGENSYLELRSMIRIYGNAYRTPNNDILYRDRTRSGLAGLARLLMEAQLGEELSCELNTYQTYIPSHMVSSQAGLGTVLDVERSSMAEWSLSNSEYVHTAVDRLNFRWSKDRVDLIIGRQPINLATTYFFSPNDFFAPFAAQAFYRLYKPGVDAIRAEIRLGNFSQLSLISVMGYHPDMSGITGWGDSPADGKTSFLARISSVFNNFEWALNTGTIRGDNVVGGSLQGEIFYHMGIRAEGNVSYPDNNTDDSRLEFSIGIDRHWANSLDLRLEYFYHGTGSDNPSEYVTMPLNTGGLSSYIGNNYLAFGMGYEFTPLFRGNMSLISNIEDSSGLFSLYGVYSLSNETDLSINLGIPFGKTPEGLLIESEFGLSPYSVNIELRHYF